MCPPPARDARPASGARGPAHRRGGTVLRLRRPRRARSRSASSTRPTTAPTTERRVHAAPPRPRHVVRHRARASAPGQRYGLRVDGAWDPRPVPAAQPRQAAARPYARAIEGGVHLDPAVYGHPSARPARRPPGARRPRLGAAHAPLRRRRRRVRLGRRRLPERSLAESLIYEVHVKSATTLHPGVPEELRGTYAGLAHPAVVDHLTGSASRPSSCCRSTPSPTSPTSCCAG